jgi:flagellar FliJ protein
MAQFDFPLEGVLRHRRHVEQELQRDLAQLQQQIREAQDELRELNQSMQASLGDVRDNRLVGKLDLGFLAAHRRYVAAMQRKGMGMAQKMALIQRDVDKAQKALAEAAKQRKIIEKLREKQHERWKHEQNRKEAVELDEVSMRLAANGLSAECGEQSSECRVPS